MPVKQQLAQDQKLGETVRTRFEAQLKVISLDVATARYLDDLGNALATQLPHLSNQKVKVQIVDHDSRKNRSLPGVYIYLSRKFINDLQYESELAAAIAVELGHVQRRHFARKLAPNADAAGVAQAFEYSDEESAEATEDAVHCLFSAGYDPRGVALYWKSFRKIDKSAARFEELSYEAAGNHPPLLNPIVKSDRFTRLLNKFVRL